ncbi:MAG: hypothetical protein OXC40_04025 [Proteobacteria bacterium]|nr:hypothetical protein [Pseudomonadota bacterium]
MPFTVHTMCHQMYLKGTIFFTFFIKSNLFLCLIIYCFISVPVTLGQDEKTLHPLPPSHQIQLGLAIQTVNDFSYQGPAVETTTSPHIIHRTTFVSDHIYSLRVHYSYIIPISDHFGYFLGTGSEFVLPAQIQNVSLPFTYNIPSLWLGLLYAHNSKMNIICGFDIALRWMEPVSVGLGNQGPNLTVGLKAHDFEVLIQGNYATKPYQFIFISLGREWLFYRLPENALLKAPSPLNMELSIGSWKASVGMSIHF